MRRRYIQKKSNFRKFIEGSLSIVVVVVILLLEIESVKGYQRYAKIKTAFSYDFEEFRLFDIRPSALEALKIHCNNSGEDILQQLTLRMLLYGFELKKVSQANDLGIKQKYVNKLCESTEYKVLYDRYQAIYADIKYFPIPKDLTNHETVAFSDSWLSKRTYGGERFHEGCDVMPSKKESGYYPIVSITDGVVEKKGWLEKGGYRIGIRSKNGGYFYYAHLQSYADGIKEGDAIKAGQLLGFMGDTGYGKEEGTSGKFAVHLHLGIYLNIDNKEVSINPYYILKYLEAYQLEYYY